MNGQLRTLFACPYNEHAYVTGLCDALQAEGVAIDTGLDKFWMHGGAYDVVHLQWPESLLAWRSPLWSEVRQLLTDVIPKWRETAKVIATRHNVRRHDIGDHRPGTDYLYEHLYRHVDGVVHLGQAGLDEFKRDHTQPGCLHSVIPLPVYAGYQPSIERVTARQLLGVPKRAAVILVFGSVRNAREHTLVQAAFLQARIPSKILVAPSFGTPVRPSRRQPLRWLLWELRNREVLWPRRLRVASSGVSDDRVHLYFSAADVVLLPRLDTLNSGVLPLAFQFGRVVVGPDVGNMGPILRATGNPVFDPDSIDSCVAALETGVRVATQGLGGSNRNYAETQWQLPRIAQMHVEFYRMVTRFSTHT